MVTRLDQAAIGGSCLGRGNAGQPQPCAPPHPRWPIAVLVRGSQHVLPDPVLQLFDGLSIFESVVFSGGVSPFVVLSFSGIFCTLNTFTSQADGAGPWVAVRKATHTT